MVKTVSHLEKIMSLMGDLNSERKSNAQLKEENEELKWEMGLLRQKYLLSQNCFHELQATFDRVLEWEWDTN
ncbi:unnamed protein product, partial [Allacma fusca]